MQKCTYLHVIKTFIIR